MTHGIVSRKRPAFSQRLQGKKERGIEHRDQLIKAAARIGEILGEAAANTVTYRGNKLDRTTLEQLILKSISPVTRGVVTVKSR